MVSALPRLFATWHAAEAPDIDVARVEWQELARLVRTTAPLRPFADTSSFAAGVLADVLAARRVLTCTPLPPSHELAGLGELVRDVERFVSEHPGHSLCAQLRKVAAALRDLTVTDSPVATKVAEVLSGYGQGSDGAPEAVLIVPRRGWLNAVRAWLVYEEFDCVDIACPADLRARLVEHRAAVLAGHPATAFSSAFRIPEVAVQVSGWVLTAPPALQVRLVLTADAPPLNLDEPWLLPAPAHPSLHVCDNGPQRNEWLLHDWLEGDATAPVGRAPRPAAAVGEDEMLAVEFHLASGHAMFFHPEVGPRPHVVAVDDETGGVALSTAPISAVTRGALLAVRVGAAPYGQVVSRADAWLQRRRGWTPEKIAEVRGCAAALKVALRSALANIGQAGLHRILAGTLTDEYARVLLHNPLDEMYIAPQRRPGFDALIAAVGARALADRYDDLAAVRTAHQQAGDEIRRELLALLRDRRWVADVDEEGWAVLHAGELGALLLAVATARIDEPMPIARTWLGELVDSNGRRVTTVAAKEGAT